MKLYQSLTSEIGSDLLQNLLKLLDFKVFVFLFVGHLVELFFFFLLLLFAVDVLLSLQMFGRSAFLDLTFANVAPHFNLSVFFVVFPMLFFDIFFVFHIILLLLLLLLFFVPAVVVPFLFQASYAILIYVMEFIRDFCSITLVAIFLLHTYYSKRDLSLRHFSQKERNIREVLTLSLL